MALKGRRKHGDKNQRQASAITEEPLAMLSPFDSEELARERRSGTIAPHRQVRIRKWTLEP